MVKLFSSNFFVTCRGSVGSSAVAVAGTPVPVNTAIPETDMGIGGQYVGETVNCTSPGTWTNSPTSYEYQWDNGSGEISGATSSSLVLTEALMNASVHCKVTAINAGGSSEPAESNSATTKAATLANTAAPLATTDSESPPMNLAVTNGTWDVNPPSPAPTYGYQWYNETTAIPGAVSSTYYAEVSAGFACEVTAYTSYFPSGVIQLSNYVP